MIGYSEFLHDRIYRECLYLIESLNEKTSFEKFSNVWIKIVNKISTLSDDAKKKIIRGFIISAIAIAPISSVVKFIFNNLNSDISEQVIEVMEDETVFCDATGMKLSQKGRDLIKEHEGYRSKAYDIGDGMITIGWGHAEPIRNSKYRIGQEISEEEANKLLADDLTKTADGIRRMFQDWKNSGVYVPISQDMFDSLVSLAFNSGISGLRKSEIIKYLKEKNYEKAGESIKNHKVNRKFRGLFKRRKIESNLFLSFCSE